MNSLKGNVRDDDPHNEQDDQFERIKQGFQKRSVLHLFYLTSGLIFGHT